MLLFGGVVLVVGVCIVFLIFSLCCFIMLPLLCCNVILFLDFGVVCSFVCLSVCLFRHYPHYFFVCVCACLFFFKWCRVGCVMVCDSISSSSDSIGLLVVLMCFCLHSWCLVCVLCCVMVCDIFAQCC